MKKIIKRQICFILAMIIVITSVNTSAYADIVNDNHSQEYNILEAEPVVSEFNPEKAAEVLNKFVESAATILKKSEKDAAKWATILEKAGGITNALTGVTAILEMTGVIKDPTAASLEKILDYVEGMAEELGNIEKQLDGISEQILELAVDIEEKDRQNKAMELLSYWRKFRTDYVEPLDNAVDTYMSKVRFGVKEWWQEDSHNNEAMCYKIVDGEESFLCVRVISDNSIPSQGDNGDNVNKDISFVMPAGYMPSTKNIAFKPDTYADDFANLAKDKIKAAIEAKEVSATETFYASWEALSDEDKDKKALTYAYDLLGEVTYQVSCECMSKGENVEFVSNVLSAYKNYCNNIVMKDSGVDAFVNVQYLTHGFEGEIADDINHFFDSMIVAAGYYGMLAISVAGQDENLTTAEKTEVRDTWINTIDILTQKKKGALTGSPNFCYIANSKIELSDFSVQLSVTDKYHYFKDDTGLDDVRGHESDSYDSWAIVDKAGTKVDSFPVIGDIKAVVLLHTFFAGRTDDKATFGSYLSQNGITKNASDLGEELLTSYTGPQSFMLTEKKELTSKIITGNNFKDSQKYAINGTKYSNSTFKFHDDVKANIMSVKTGEDTLKTIISSAFYEEHSAAWRVDEAVVFTDGEVEIKTLSDARDKNSFWTNKWVREDKAIVSKKFQSLVYSQNNSSDITLNENSPLLAFDACYAIVDKVEPQKIESKADWSECKLSHLDFYLPDDDKIEDGLLYILNMQIDRARRNGGKVDLSIEQRSELVETMKTYLYQVQKEIKKNNSLLYFDSLGIDNNSVAKLSLAEDVLPSAYLDYNGKSKVDADNIKLSVIYEPFVFVDFAETDGIIEPVLNPAYIIEPRLIVWDSSINEFKGFTVGQDVLSKHGLKFNVRIPVSVCEETEKLDVTEYDNITELSIRKELSLEVIGSGNNRYLDVETGNCSLFKLNCSKSDVWGYQIDDMEYTGGSVKPKVKLYYHNKLLKENVDYKLSYANNKKAYTVREGQPDFDKTKAPRIVITGKTYFKNKITTYFVINQKSLNDDDININVDDKVFAKNKDIKSMPVIKYGKNVLKRDRDYDVTFNGNLRNIGVVQVVISGKGNYVGSITSSYKIYDKNKKMTSLYVVPINKQIYTGSEIRPEVVVKAHKSDELAISKDDYSVKYVNNLHSGKATVIITGKGKYSEYGGRKVVTFKIDRKDIRDAIISVSGNMTYTGKKVTPTVEVRDADTNEIISPDNYKVSFARNVNVSSVTPGPTVKITGRKDYKGSCSKGFDIKPLHLDENSGGLIAKIDDIKDKASGIKPKDIKSSVQYNRKKLVRGKDYEVMFSRDEEKSRQCANIVFKGNYEGSVKVYFEIRPLQ